MRDTTVVGFKCECWPPCIGVVGFMQVCVGLCGGATGCVRGLAVKPVSPLRAGEVGQLKPPSPLRAGEVGQLKPVSPLRAWIVLFWAV